MKTINSVPENYTGSICSHLYEANFDLQIRNITMLLLAMQYPNGDAAELITHLWYSASIPLGMYSLLKEVEKLLKDIAESVEDSPQDHATVTIIVGSSSIELRLKKGQFAQLCSRLESARTESFNHLETRRLAYVYPVNPLLKWRIWELFGTMPRHRRLTERTYRHSGILLPINSEIPPLRLRCPNP